MVKALLILSVFVLLPGVNYSGKRNSSINQGLLDQHNYYRKIAGIHLLKWSPALEKPSTEWARYLKEKKNCKSEHSTNAFRSNKGGFSYIGENLAYKWHSLNIVPADKELGEEVVTAWYNEIADFQYSSEGVVCPRRGKKQAIGHFTQVMWSGTTHLGCGYATCDQGKSVIVVCQYGPGGNFNIHKTPPFSPAAAKRLDQHPVNQKFGGLPVCKRRKGLDVDRIKEGLNIPQAK